MTEPIIALTMGDPAGIGPEIIIKALMDPAARARCRPLIIGDPAVMARAAALVPGAPALRTISRVDEALYGEAIDVLPTLTPAPPVVFWGAISLETSRAMLAPPQARIIRAPATSATISSRVNISGGRSNPSRST